MANSTLPSSLTCPSAQRLFSHEDSSFQMFSSEAYGHRNLLFKDSTTELVPIATQTYEAWLGREYLHAMKGLLCDPNSKATCPSCRPQPRCTALGQGSWGRWRECRTLTQEAYTCLCGTLSCSPLCFWGYRWKTPVQVCSLWMRRHWNAGVS